MKISTTAKIINDTSTNHLLVLMMPTGLLPHCVKISSCGQMLHPIYGMRMS